MSEKVSRPKPPYPTIGELCQLLSGAFDTKSADPSSRKNLNRLAVEGDFDWTLRPRIVKDLITRPLRKFDKDLASAVEGFVSSVLDQYIEYVGRVSLDAMSREEATPKLIETFGAAHVAMCLIVLRDKFGGPDLNDLLKQNEKPIDVVFDWADKALEIDVAGIAFSEDKQKRDEIGRWRRAVPIPKRDSNGRRSKGDPIPDFFASIIPLVRRLREKLPERKDTVSLFGKWLVIARALTWLAREMPDAEYESLFDLVRKEIASNIPRDIGAILSRENNKAGERLSDLRQCGLTLMTSHLMPTEPKKQGDQASARHEIDRFMTLADEFAPDGRTRYFLDWCEGRWHVLSGNETDAIRFYEKAADGALYRAGENQKMLIEEALALAAHLRKKPLLKRLKHRALVMGFFAASDREKTDVVAGWEVEQMAQAFGKLFPLEGRFPEASSSRRQKELTSSFIDLTATDRIKPDLANPDRVISIPVLKGGKLRYPQLVWFASQGRANEVKCLLEAGVDVNKLERHGGSALLCALQFAESRGQHEALNLLLEKPHKREVLDRLTDKKALTPLYLAVQLGDPSVVARLLQMGATADLAAGYPLQTPLYNCISKFKTLPHELAKRQILDRLAASTKEDRESKRRYLGGGAGVMGERISMPDFANPRHAAILSEVLSFSIENDASKPKENFVEIAKLLLAHEADPNRRHTRPGPGRTPLMLAAEFDAVEVFRLMTEAGGDSFRKDDQGNDSHAIARSFGSKEVLGYLNCFTDTCATRP